MPRLLKRLDESHDEAVFRVQHREPVLLFDQEYPGAAFAGGPHGGADLVDLGFS
jgi:hypothetical protein